MAKCVEIELQIDFHFEHIIRCIESNKPRVVECHSEMLKVEVLPK